MVTYPTVEAIQPKENVKKTPLFLMLLFAFGVLFGCGTPHSTPKLITADGTTYFACQGILWTSDDSGLLGGETTYEISFTDGDGVDHDIRGIKHLEMSDLPAMVPYDLPYPMPDPKTGTDRDGKPYIEGNTYTFADGAEATIRDGQWKPLQHKNPACVPSPQ